MIPVEVFHYTTNCNVLRILTGRQLRFGTFEFTNDPKESKLWVEQLIGILGVIVPNTGRYYDQRCREITDEINRIKFTEWKVLCVSKHHQELESVQLDQRSKIKGKVDKSL